jgi:hypothetical protein
MLVGGDASSIVIDLGRTVAEDVVLELAVLVEMVVLDVVEADLTVVA